MIINKVEKSQVSNFNFDNVEFGENFTDHMLVCEYAEGQWGTPKIMPYGKLSFAPSMMALHYGQASFEGLKAYKDASGQVNLFRPDKNFNRLNKSCERLRMPQIPEELFFEGVKTLVSLDSAWIPDGKEGASLYVRPVVFASEEALRARIAHRYMFVVLLSPAAVYYAQSVSVKVADYYSRSANGGVGYAKAAGNYGAAFLPTELVKEEGYDQIIWTDAATHTYVEESGTMNLFVRIGDKLVTPPTSERILDGVTRDSVITLARHLGYEVEERLLKVDELYQAHKDGTLKEAFGCGTAVVISYFKEIGYKNERLPLVQRPDEDNWAKRLKEVLEGMQTGKNEDIFGWRMKC